MEIFLSLIGRVLLGGYFIKNAHNHLKNTAALAGYAGSKNVKQAKFAVMMTGFMLLVGGVGILLGVFVKFSIALVAIFLIGVTYKMHRYWEVEDPMQRMGEHVNFYKNLALLGAVLMLLAIPTPWFWTLF